MRKLVAEEADAQLCLLVGVAHEIRHESMLSMDRFFQARFQCDVTFFDGCIVSLELCEHLSFNEFQMLCEIEISIRQECAVRWVIVFGMEVLQIFVLKIWNEFRLTTRVELIL